ASRSCCSKAVLTSREFRCAKITPVRRALGPKQEAIRSGWLAAAAASLLAPAAIAQTPGSAVPDAPLRLAAPVRPVKSEAPVYIVKLTEPGAATYKGGTPGFAATKPSPGRKLDSSSSEVESYVAHLESSHDRM